MASPMEMIEKLNDTIEARFKSIEDSLGKEKERGEKLGKDAEEKDKTFAEQQKTLDDLKSLRETVEKYAKQIPMHADRDKWRGDPDYVGLWPNAKMAKAFGLFVVGKVCNNPERRESYAKALVEYGCDIRQGEKRTLVPGDVFVKAMSAATDPGGGYLVPDVLEPGILRRVNEYGAVGSRLTLVPMSTLSHTFIKRTGGLAVSYPDIGGSPTESDMTFGKVSLSAKKWSVLTFIDEDLESDTLVGIGELVLFEMALAIAIAEDTNAFLGDGTGTYAGTTGVFSSANVAVITMPATKTAFTDVTYSDLINLRAAVPTWAKNLPDAAYFMSGDIAAMLERMVDGNGRPLFQHPTEGFPLRVCGKPVVEVEVLPDTGDSAVSTKFIAFGSLQAWGILGRRQGIAIKRSDQVKFLEDQIALKLSLRQVIQEAYGEAMAVLRTAAS